MDIGEVLKETGMEHAAITKINGGRDSSVWKVQWAGKEYALRMLPSKRSGQFLQEQKIMEWALEAGLPVPAVRLVKRCGESVIMLLDWAEGKTILEELILHPGRGESLGQSFGAAHAAIHKCAFPFELALNWIAPRSKEEEVISERIMLEGEEKALLHMDFHPLNVMTDGEKITAILDWTNCSVGDPRYDTARTYSIFKLVEGDVSKYGLDPAALHTFQHGWREGYEKESARSLVFPDLYTDWAGQRLADEWRGELPAEQLARIIQRIGASPSF